MSNNLIESNCSDLPAIEDLLGTDKQQSGLVEFMRKCGTPMTIAVQGDWGTGKTSMMQLLKNQLDDINGSTLWFPTWQFAVLGEQDRLLMDLLMFICSKFEKKIEEIEKKYEENKIEIPKEEKDNIDKIKVIKNKVIKLFKRVKDPVGIGLFYLLSEVVKKLTNADLSKTLGEIINTLKEQDKEENGNKDEINITYESYVLQVSELHDNLKELINAYLKLNKTKRLYIFIDDLDRLEPVRAVELLEGIKNFLDIPRCVFMLAIDTKVVMEGLKAKYGENMDEDKLVHFFDKIIQIPYKLPVHNYKLKAFMEDVLKGYDEKNVDKYIKFLESADIRNPRTIKRCVNFCLLHHYMDGEDAVSQKDDNVKLHRFAVKMLELEREDLYWELLAKVRSLGTYYSEIKKWLLVEEELKCVLFYKVLECFGIDENADEKNIETFADYIIRSAPADMAVVEYFEDAQKMQNIIQRLLRPVDKIYSVNYLGKTYERMYIQFIWGLSAHKIAKDIEENKEISIKFKYGNVEILVNYDSKEIRPLHVFISGVILDQYFLEKYCINGLSEPITDSSKIIYRINNASDYIFENIQDTSSPNAPIYKILQATGVIKIPTELTLAAP